MRHEKIIDPDLVFRSSAIEGESEKEIASIRSNLLED